MPESLKQIEVITLFVSDVAAAKAFYAKVFAVEEVYADENCAVVKFDNLMINLLQEAEAPMLVEPAPVAPQKAGARMVITIQVKSVDAVCQKLKSLGVVLLNGPIDRPWGRRTAAFADPAGHCWEVAELI